MTSRTYQLAATARDRGTMSDDLHHSHAMVQPLEAEQLLDALAQVTGVPVQFRGYPLGMRANQIPAPPQTGRRFGGEGMGERFLKVFGKPERLLTCECERNDDPGLLQAFQLITGDLMNSLVRDPDNRLGKMLSAGKSDSEMLEEFYLAALCRPPTAMESRKLLALLAAAKDRRAAWEDVLWALLNSKEFPVAEVSVRAEISYDLVMEEEMTFVEGTYRLPGGEWQVFILTTLGEATAPHWTFSQWESRVMGVFARFPRNQRLNKATAETILSEALGVTEWVEVRGPDSMNLR